jgi:hypothetical protein
VRSEGRLGARADSFDTLLFRQCRVSKVPKVSALAPKIEKGAKRVPRSHLLI